MEVKLETPWPPSVNRYWRMARGRFYIAKPGIEYREAVRDLVYEQNLDRQMKGRLSFRADLFPPDRRRRDADNVLKAMLDALQHSELLDDDNQFKRLHVEATDIVVPEGMVRMTLSELDPVTWVVAYESPSGLGESTVEVWGESEQHAKQETERLLRLPSGTAKSATIKGKELAL